MSTLRAPRLAWTATAVLVVLAAAAARAEQCGEQAGNVTCPNCLCCSRWGWCGDNAAYCGDGCQSQCGGCGPSPVPPPPPRPLAPAPYPAAPAPIGPSPVASIVSRDLFETLLLHRNDPVCPANGFYTYDAFITAAAAFPDFGGKGDAETRKREVAAFLGQTSHETTGGWQTAPDGPYSWGYCFKQENGATADYCVPSAEWPCAPGKKYFGRGPIQLSYNYNYGPAGRAIGVDLLNNPDLVATDPVVSFKTALWFWMTPQAPKPSCHAVATGEWTPSDADNKAGRVPGYGVMTNIINGGLECGIGPDDRVKNRIGFYQRYCDILGVNYGPNLDCNTQRPFNSGSSVGLAAQ